VNTNSRQLWKGMKMRMVKIVPESWNILHLHEKMFTLLVPPFIGGTFLLLILSVIRMKTEMLFIMFIIFGISLSIYVYFVLKKFSDPLYELIHQMANIRKLRISLDKTKTYSGEWEDIYSEIRDIVEKQDRMRKVLADFFEFLHNLGLLMKENILHLDKNVKVQKDSMGNTTQYMDKLSDIMSKIYYDVQSLSISIGNTVFSFQIMGKNIENVAVDGQKMGESVQRTSQLINKMADSINDVGKNIESTSALASLAAQTAVDGNSIVVQTVSAMSHIYKTMEQFSETIMKLGKRSDEIGKIIATIDDIADQTNLLSLNAAIEAARAGEHGRGFAVVASEVRKLADKTTDATKEITNMIKSIQAETRVVIGTTKKGMEEIKQGVVLADQAGDSLKEIVQTIEGVSLLMNNIAESTKVQGERSKNITESVDEMNNLTRQVVTATKEQNDSSRLLTQVAVDMQTVASSAVEKLESHDKDKETMQTSMDSAREATLMSLAAVESMLKIAEKLEQKVRELKEKTYEN
jgi:methyl-accepting chemotaxis protein